MFEKVNYKDLNARQQEQYNFQKVSGLLADYGITTIKLSDDRNGADFIALGMEQGSTIDMKVQLKGRVTFDKKYEGKGLFVCFIDRKKGGCYLYDHDELFKKFSSRIGESKSRKLKGNYSFPYITKEIRKLLNEYFIGYAL